MQKNTDKYPDSASKESSTNIEPSSLKNIPAYQIYLEKRRRKETALFTQIAIVLSILFTVSLLLSSGLLPIPFLNDFSKKIHYANIGDIPCPIGEMPVKPEKIKISILNGTEVSKLASKTGSDLKGFKFQITKMANADNSDYEEPALILTSAKQVDDAYTVALALPNSMVKLSQVNEVTVILGQGFNAPIKAEEFKELMKQPLKSPKSCLPVE